MTDQSFVSALLFKFGGLHDAHESRRLRWSSNDGQQLTDSLVNSIDVGLHVPLAAACPNRQQCVAGKWKIRVHNQQPNRH